MKTQDQIELEFARFLTESKRMIPMGVCHGIDEYPSLFEGACDFLASKNRDAKKHMHEEFLEAIEAIEGNDSMHAIEEMGDAIFTMLRYAHEQGHKFSLDTVIRCSTMKLSRRKDVNSLPSGIGATAIRGGVTETCRPITTPND